VSGRDGKEALRPGKEFRAGAEREATMRAKEREPARMRLDHELRYYRLAGREKRPTQQLLRRVRQVLGLRSADLAREVGVNRSVLFRLEDSEARGTISLNAMTRVAQAMGCKVVYAVTPRNGLTLQEMVERKKWTKVLAAEEAGDLKEVSGNSEPKAADSIQCTGC